MEKKIIWQKDDVKVGNLIFKKGKEKKIKRYIELSREVVLVVPVDKNYVYLIKEYRPFLNKTAFRIPAGTVDKNETSLQAAKRELKEETGIVAAKLTLVNKYKYFGWVKFPITIYKAENLTITKAKIEFYEKIKLYRVSSKEAIRIALNKMDEPHHAFAILKVLLGK